MLQARQMAGQIRKSAAKALWLAKMHHSAVTRNNLTARALLKPVREKLQLQNYQLSLALTGIEMVINTNGIAGVMPSKMFEPLVDWETNPEYDSGTVASNIESRQIGFILHSQEKVLSLPAPGVIIPGIVT